MSVVIDSGCFHNQLPWLTWLQSKTAIIMPIKFLKVILASYIDHAFSGVRCLPLIFQSRNPVFYLTVLKTGNQTQMQIGKLNNIIWPRVLFGNQVSGHAHRNKILPISPKRPHPRYFTKIKAASYLPTQELKYNSPGLTLSETAHSRHSILKSLENQNKIAAYKRSDSLQREFKTAE